MPKGDTAPVWKGFELAVARFAAAMDPRAIVRHNAFTRDSDTGRRRQRDVWIEATLCGLFPITAHVSCKRHKRRLDEGDIDTFIGELSSSRAHLGVIYSFQGFTQPAIEKAKERRICCCRLYAEEPADIPEIIWFDAFCCSPRISLSLDPYPAPGWDLKNWDDLLQIKLGHEADSPVLLDEIVRRFHESEKAAVEDVKRIGEFPRSFEAELGVLSNGSGPNLKVALHGTWKFHRAKLEAFLLNGSYSFTENKFAGSVATPSVDLHSSDPGSGWELLEAPPGEIENTVLVVRYCADARGALLLLAKLAPLPMARGN
jgi:hypothetical protein